MVEDADKAKKERSPSFPFISLKKAEERARSFYEKHRREASRLPAVANSWTYQPKSSGFQQTIAALKQYGLLEDFGSGEERKLQLSELGRRLVADQRPGAREAALREAALRPRLFLEYLKWAADPPSESHRLSELELDRGFNPNAAKDFIRAFDETVVYAGIKHDDSVSAPPEEDGEEESGSMNATEAPLQGAHNNMGLALAGPLDPQRLAINQGPGGPLAQRLKVEMTVNALSVTAILTNGSEVAKLIAMLQAMTPLLPEGKAEQPN